MAERSETPQVDSTRELAELLRLHFEASRSELSEYLEQWAKKALAGATMMIITIVLAGLGGLFLLIAAVLAIGDALDHHAWGLLIVGGVLIVIGGAFGMTQYLIGKNRRDQESG
jgi:hypothetical protein